MSSVSRRISSAGAVVKVGTGLVACIPSAAILIGVLPVPESVRTLAEYSTSIVSIVFVIAIFLLGDAIDRIPKGLTATLVMLAAIGSVASGVAYFNFTSRHVVELAQPVGADVVLPIHPSSELRSLMSPYGADYTEALATSIQRARIIELINHENSSAIFVMVGLIVLAQILIVSALVAGAWRLARD